jgi:hypothetical protein
MTGSCFIPPAKPALNAKTMFSPKCMKAGVNRIEL